jgi:acetyl coenzyme A synthetase (ADP forming)-like protein
MERLFYPRTIAVVGASGNPQKLGFSLISNLATGFTGALYPVSLREEEILGMKCYKSLSEINDSIDLVLIIVPADQVLPVVEECVRKGVRYAVVLSGGFSEIGHAGELLEKNVLKAARAGGMRIVGPNCVGIMNMDASMNASFTLTPKKGNISLIFQSGALGSSVIYIAINENIGVNKFVSIGNMCDLDFSDFISYLESDATTHAIAVYMEGLREGRKFLEALYSFEMKKPIVVFKAGNTFEGMKAVSSHTGSLAGNEKIFKAAFRQARLIQVDTLTELLDASRAFLGGTLSGKRIAIMTNAGGPGILAVDALQKSGLSLAELSEISREKLKIFLPPFAALSNPIDMIASARYEQFKKCIQVLEDDENVDAILAIIVITTFAGMTSTEQAEGLVSGYRGIKPVLACCMAGEISQEATRILENAGIVCYASPERAVFALGKQLQFLNMKKKTRAPLEGYAFEQEPIEEIFLQVKKGGRHQLLECEAKQILTCSGFDVPPFILAHNFSECQHAVSKIGYPVVLKISSEDIIHKTDVGGVRLNIRNEDELRVAYEDMMRSFGSEDILVNKMIMGGTEMIVGATDDPQFGPVVMCGLGGIFVEAVGDTSFRIAPVGREEADEMVSELHSSKILFGIRGGRRADVEALTEAIVRLSSLVSQFRDIVEVDINPLTVLEKGRGAQVVDARMTLRH